MFPGFLVVRRMNYGRSTTNARRRPPRLRGHARTRGVQIAGERRKSGAINSFKTRGEREARSSCSVYVLTNNRSYSFQSVSRINSSGEISSSNWDEWCCEIKVSKFDRGKGFLLYLCEICFLISNGIRWFRNGNVNTIFEVRSSFLR